MAIQGRCDSGKAADVLGNVVAQNTKKWLGFVRRMVGNDADAQDVVQEAIHKVLLRRPDLSDEDEARMYLARTITNTAIEYYHRDRRERRKRIAVERQSLMDPAGAGNPELHLQRREWRSQHRDVMQVLRDGISQLPRSQYEALRITVLDEAAPSMRDAGALHGIPYSTLRHRTLQGLRRLRSHLRRRLGDRVRTAAQWYD